MTDEQAYETMCIGCWRESQCHEDMEYCDEFLMATAITAMGLDENGPAFWKEHIHVTKDIQSGEEIKRYKDGWYCSRCGKWLNYRAKQCSGCGADMQEDEE